MRCQTMTVFFLLLNLPLSRAILIIFLIFRHKVLWVERFQVVYPFVGVGVGVILCVRVPPFCGGDVSLSGQVPDPLDVKLWLHADVYIDEGPDEEEEMVRLSIPTSDLIGKYYNGHHGYSYLYSDR